MQLRTKAQQLSSVDTPNLVKVLILAKHIPTYSDFYFLKGFINLIKLDLSANRLTSFPIDFKFTCFSSLRTLFLHDNKFCVLKNLKCISQNSTIEYLTLFGNPLEQVKVRHYFVNQMENLKIIDETIITTDERTVGISSYVNNHTQIKINFPIITTQSSESSSRVLAVVIQELYVIRKRYLKANPIIHIQRWFKKLLRTIKKQKIPEIVSYQDCHHLSTNQQQLLLKKMDRNKLKTQKLSISRSNQEIIVSIFQMNSSFLQLLQEIADGPIYAERVFCQQNNISFSENQQGSLICLRKPEQNTELPNKICLQFVIKTSQRYLIRKRGKQISSDFEKKSNFKLPKQKQKYHMNSTVSQAMRKLQFNYLTDMVLLNETPQVKFHLLKNLYIDAKLQTVGTVNSLFPFCIGYVLQRTQASIAIQRAWRGSQVRKIYGNCYQKIRQKYSSIKIQRWIRSLGVKHRHCFFTQIRSYLKKQNTKTITLTMPQLYSLEDKYQNNSKGINFTLEDQKFLVTFSNNDHQFSLSYHRHNRARHIFPAYITELLELFNLQNQHRHQNVQYANISQSILQVLFKEVQAVYYWKNKSTANQYVTFKYRTLEETKSRKFLIALASFSFSSCGMIRSLNLQPCAGIIQILTQINTNYFFSNQKSDQNPLDRLEHSHIKKTIKNKLFINNEYVSTNLSIFVPRSFIRKHIREQSMPIQNDKFMQCSSLMEGGRKKSLQRVDRSYNCKVGFKSTVDYTKNTISFTLNRLPQSVYADQSLNKLHRMSDESISDYPFDGDHQRIGSENVDYSIGSSLQIDTDSYKLNKDNQQMKRLPKMVNYRYNNAEVIQNQGLRYDSFKTDHNKYLKYAQQDYEIGRSLPLKQKKNLQQLREEPMRINQFSKRNPHLVKNQLTKHQSTKYQLTNQLAKHPSGSLRKSLNSEVITQRAKAMRNIRKNYKQTIQSQQDCGDSMNSDNYLQKKQRIRQLQEQHKFKLQENEKHKRLQLEKLKKELRQSCSDNTKIIERNRIARQEYNLQRHDRVKAITSKESKKESINPSDNQCKQAEKSTIVRNSQSINFETDFTVKGNQNIRMKLLNFERARGNSLNNRRQSSNASHKQSQEKLLINNPTGANQPSKVLQRKAIHVKTDIKQFSMMFDEEILPSYSFDEIERNNRSSLNNQKKADSSNKQLQGIDKSDDKKVKLLNNAEKSDSQMNKVDQIGRKQAKNRQSSHKIEKKKSVVHSIWPDQLYPLKSSRKIGFQLPKMQQTDQYTRACPTKHQRANQKQYDQ